MALQQPVTVPVEEYERVIKLLAEVAEKYQEAVEHLFVASAILDSVANCTEECDCDTQVVIAYVNELKEALLSDDENDEQSTPPNTGGT